MCEVRWEVLKMNAPPLGNIFDATSISKSDVISFFGDFLILPWCTVSVPSTLYNSP